MSDSKTNKEKTKDVCDNVSRTADVVSMIAKAISIFLSGK